MILLPPCAISDSLQAWGILYAPDDLINAGGLIYVALKHQGESLPAITAHLAQISRQLAEIFGYAQADKRSPGCAFTACLPRAGQVAKLRAEFTADIERRYGSRCCCRRLQQG